MWLNKCVLGFIVTTLGFIRGTLVIHTYKILYQTADIKIVSNTICGLFVQRSLKKFHPLMLGF